MVFYVYEEPSCMMAKKPSTPKMKQPCAVSRAQKCRAQPYDCQKRRAQPYDCQVSSGSHSAYKAPKYCLIPALVPMSHFSFYDFMLGGKLFLHKYTFIRWLILNAQIAAKVVCFSETSAEMFKKPLWQTVWTKIRLLLYGSTLFASKFYT